MTHWSSICLPQHAQQMVLYMSSREQITGIKNVLYQLRASGIPFALVEPTNGLLSSKESQDEFEDGLEAHDRQELKQAWLDARRKTRQAADQLPVRGQESRASLI
jgi:hypothetical protein